MAEAIDRIAICAKKRKYRNILECYLQCTQYAHKGTLDNLTPEETKSITPKHKLKLSKDEINEIVKDYPFKLPVEIYDLYQRGNGVNLPIGLDNDFDIYTSYFVFPASDTGWYSIEKAMDLYRGIKDYEEIDDIYFPLFSNEWYLYVIRGSNKQEEVSSIFAIDRGLPGKPSVASSSLTNLMLACAERMEKSGSNISNEYLMKKYKIYDDHLLEETYC